MLCGTLCSTAVKLFDLNEIRMLSLEYSIEAGEEVGEFLDFVFEGSKIRI